MTENKRFTSDIHRIYDDKEQIACADTMDDAEILVDLLNEQEELIKRLKTIREEQTETILKQKRKIKELEEENKRLQIDIMGQSEEIEILSDENQQLKERNQRQYNRLKELTELMYERQWGKLENMVEEWEKQEKLLNQEWSNCGDE